MDYALIFFALIFGHAFCALWMYWGPLAVIVVLATALAHSVRGKSAWRGAFWGVGFAMIAIVLACSAVAVHVMSQPG
jgi:hypothetical protein